MSLDDDLLRLAREREAATGNALDGLSLEHPGHLLRLLRTYLFRQADSNRLRRPDEEVLHLKTLSGSPHQLTCPGVDFFSDSQLAFDLQFEEEQAGWRVRCFRFNLLLPPSRRVKMIRIHLNPESWHNPLDVPRCHLHIGDSRAHIPFPIMNPRLVLHLLCEHVEPDVGAAV